MSANAEAAEISTDIPSVTLSRCETAREIERLDGQVICEEEIDGGDRVKITKWNVTSQTEEIVDIQSGDLLIRLGGRNGEILAVGDDVSEADGLHLLEQSEDGENAIRLNLVQEWLTDNRLLVVGTRTHTEANVPTAQ